MSQVARPVANSSPQDWELPSEATGAAWEQIDDPVATHDGLTTWIQASIATLGDPPRVSRFILGPLTDPGTDSGHLVRVAHYAGRGASVDYVVRLYEGATLRASTTVHAVGDGAVDIREASFPVGEVANITSGGYSGGLILEVDSGSLSPGDGQLLVTAIELEVPSAGGLPDVRATRRGIEVLADVPTLVHATRAGLEVLGPPAMSVLTCLGWEVLGESTAAGLRASRYGLEVLRPNAQQTILTVLAWEVLANNQAIRASRAGLEVLAKNPFGTTGWVTVIAWEVLSGVPVGGLLRVTRTGIEVMAKNPPKDVVVALPLPADMPAHLLANWEQPVRMATGWQTDVLTTPETGLEERRGLVRRPSRVLEARCTAVSAQGSGRALLSASRRAVQRAPIALWQDASRITGNPDSRTVLCDTRWRRFVPGARVVLHRIVGGRPADVCYRILVTKTDVALVLDEALPITYPVGSRVAPCIDAEVQLQAVASRQSGALLDVAVRAVEVIGPSALPGAAATMPAGAGTYAGLPILDVLTDWGDPPRVQLIVPGSSDRAGRSSVVLTAADRPVRGYDLSFPFNTRARFWELLTWADGAKGRLQPFWQVGAGGEFRAVDVGGASIDVEPTDSVADLVDFVPRIVIRTRAGALLVRGVTGVIDTGTAYRLALDVPLPALEVADILRVSAAELSRFADDFTVEEWSSGETGALTFRTLGLVDEKPVSIEVPQETGLAYTFGAKFEPPEGFVVQGLGWYSQDEAEPYLESLDGQHCPAVIQNGFNIGSFHAAPPTNQFILDKLAEAETGGGTLPAKAVVQMDLSLKDYTVNPENAPGMTSFAGFPLDYHLVTGTPYALPFFPFTVLDLDAQLDVLCAALAEWGKPVLMRIGLEFSNQTGYHADYYPQAFRKIVDRMRELGAFNVSFVYCWEPSGKNFKSDGIPLDPLEPWSVAGVANGEDYGTDRWYPGDDYVDWAGIDMFSAAQYFTEGGQFYAASKAFLAWAESRGKPVAMCEASPGTMDLGPEGALDFQGNVISGAQKWAEWFVPFFAFIAANPIVKWFNYIDHDYDAEGEGSLGASLGWHTHLLDDELGNAIVLGLYVDKVSEPQFIDLTGVAQLNRYAEFQP